MDDVFYHPMAYNELLTGSTVPQKEAKPSQSTMRKCDKMSYTPSCERSTLSYRRRILTRLL